MKSRIAFAQFPAICTVFLFAFCFQGLAQKPWIAPIPGTTKQAHLQENLWAIDYEFTADELKTLTEEVSKIKIVGNRN